jgi:hypothetical protein
MADDPKRLDGNGQEENKDVDTRRWMAEDNEGHLKGSNLSRFNEKAAREAEDNDRSRLNKLDNREELNDEGRRDL